MNYEESVQYIHSLLTFGMRPGLERISELLELLGNPQDKLKTVHIAGTNGKGSTSTMISNMLIADGKNTGLFTSPYVFDFSERIQINGKNAPEKMIAESISRVREKTELLKKKDIVITEFEAITAAAFLCFSACGCEYAVIEVGLGGRFDATNVLKSPLVSVITSISLDHTAVLGDTIKKIAFEKCGIIKEGAPVVTSKNQLPEALGVIEKTVEEKKGKLIISDPGRAKIISRSVYGTRFSYEGNEYFLRLAGSHQTENAVNAVEAAKLLGISAETVRRGMENTIMPARMEIAGEKPLIIRDGGHNEGCAGALYEYLTGFKINNIKMIVGMMADKNTEEYLKKIAPLCDSVVTVTPSNPRAAKAEELLKTALKYCADSKAVSNPKKAFEQVKAEAKADDTLLICGSFYLMSDIFN